MLMHYCCVVSCHARTRVNFCWQVWKRLQPNLNELVEEEYRAFRQRSESAGGNAPQGCGPTCNQNHTNDGNCLLCGKPWGNHSGHNCSSMPGHPRGSWVPGAGSGGAAAGGVAHMYMSMGADFKYAVTFLRTADAHGNHGSATSDQGHQVRACVRVRACLRACLRACVRMRVRACGCECALACLCVHVSCDVRAYVLVCLRVWAQRWWWWRWCWWWWWWQLLWLRFRPSFFTVARAGWFPRLAPRTQMTNKRLTQQYALLCRVC